MSDDHSMSIASSFPPPQSKTDILLWRKADRVGVVYPGEEKALGKVYCGLSVLTVSYMKDREQLPGPVVTRQGVKVLS